MLRTELIKQEPNASMTAVVAPDLWDFTHFPTFGPPETYAKRGAFQYDPAGLPVILAGLAVLPTRQYQLRILARPAYAPINAAFPRCRWSFFWKIINQPCW